MRPYLGASVLVLGHGAGMAHAMWLRENATIIEVKKYSAEKFYYKVFVYYFKCSETLLRWYQVGVERDLENNYLARLSDVFGLRHIKVVCDSSKDNVAAESASAPLWHQWSNLSSKEADEVRPTRVAEVPACAVALRRALADAVNEHEKQFSCVRSR